MWPGPGPTLVWKGLLTPAPHSQILWCQFLKFKETELPAKEADKSRSKGIYQSLEVRGPFQRAGVSPRQRARPRPCPC